MCGESLIYPRISNSPHTSCKRCSLGRLCPSRRSFSIQLTPKGMELCRKLIAESAGIAREIFQKAFRPEQMKQFSKLITLLLLSVEAHTREARVRGSEANQT